MPSSLAFFPKVKVEELLCLPILIAIADLDWVLLLLAFVSTEKSLLDSEVIVIDFLRLSPTGAS